MHPPSHTPGPWESVPSTVKGTGTANRDIVSMGAVFSPCHVATEVNPENARLIATAPDLLAVCLRILEAIDRPGGTVRNIPASAFDGLRSAVNKANGEQP